MHHRQSGLVEGRERGRAKATIMGILGRGAVHTVIIISAFFSFFYSLFFIWFYGVAWRAGHHWHWHHRE
jgi:hypothetical protein